MKNKKLWLWGPLLVLFMSFSYAQEKTISGNVTDQDGVPLPGVSVLVVDTTNGTQTDFDGNYTMRVNEGEVLRFSYLGQKTTERTVGNESTINVQLEEDAEALEEVVVVGYGVQTRKSLTSSVAKVDGDVIKNIATPTISGALQGSANGLQVNQNSGTPGGAFSVRVRGASSINGSNEPLYVVDGVPIISGSVGENSFGGQDNDVLSTLNFNDVESIQVLKDASSAAIYGARGANGVVLITTKRGKSGKVSVQVNSQVGFQKEINRYETFTAGEFYQFGDIAFEDAFGAPGLLSTGQILGVNIMEQQGFNSLEELYASDWGDNYVDAIYRKSPAIVKTFDVTISGGSENARFYTNFSDFNQEGVIFGQNFGRRSLSFNANFVASKNLDIEAAVTVTQTDNARIGGDNNIYGALTTSVLEIPGNDLFNDDGTFNTDPFTFSNPLQNATVDKSDTRIFRMLSNIGLRYKLAPNLVVNSKASLERIDFKELIFTPATTRRGGASGGDSNKEINLINRWNLTSTLNYNKLLGDFELTGLVGFSAEGTVTDDIVANTQNIPAGFELPGAGAVPITASNEIRENKIFSYFGRLGLSFKDRLFLEGTMRADASSVFGADNAIGYFPATSVAYVVSEEEWFKNKTLTSFKLRASWGQTGNQSGIGDFGSRFLSGVENYSPRPGTAITQLGAPNLSWETTTQYDLGADITLFDRIDITYDYFDKDTQDVLLSRPLRNSSGFTTVAANVGSITNKGHELAINARIFDKGFKWTSQFQVAYLENEVTSLQLDAAGEFIPIDQGFANRIAVGQPLGAFFGLEADGLWREGDEIPQPLLDRGVEAGDVKYVDQDGDGNIDANDRVFIGNPLPKWTGNFRNSFSFKGFDLSANFQFEEDKDIFNNSLAFGGASGSFAFNKFASQRNYYTVENTNTDIPRPRFGGLQSYNNQDSSRLVEDASYVRLKEVTLGYNFSPEVLGNGMSVRVYVGADNLVTWTDYSGLDPEVNTFGNENASRGTDFFTQGLNKTYKFGVNFKF